ncbi:hypothetical protein TNCV_3158661 [Trichonephila clavipes]|nr:hypothetical protein TNCV_3158661 [Trichonephila clavipes]
MKSPFAEWRYYKHYQAASPLVRLEKEEERLEATDHHPPGGLPQNLGETETNRTICIVLKLQQMTGVHLSPLPR